MKIPRHYLIVQYLLIASLPIVACSFHFVVNPLHCMPVRFAFHEKTEEQGKEVKSKNKA
jgi:hypothetical protein